METISTVIAKTEYPELTMKDFLKQHRHFQVSFQYLEKGVHLCLYNTTYDPIDPVYETYIPSVEVDNLIVDLETVALPLIMNWYELQKQKDKKG